MDTTLKLFG